MTEPQVSQRADSVMLHLKQVEFPTGARGTGRPPRYPTSPRNFFFKIHKNGAAGASETFHVAGGCIPVVFWDTCCSSLPPHHFLNPTPPSQFSYKWPSNDLQMTFKWPSNDRFWSKMTNFNPKWPISIKNDQFRSKMTNFESRMTNFDHKWPISTKKDRFWIENDRLRSKMTDFESKMTNFDQKRPIFNRKWPILTKNDQFW